MDIWGTEVQTIEALESTGVNWENNESVSEKLSHWMILNVDINYSRSKMTYFVKISAVSLKFQLFC